MLFCGKARRPDPKLHPEAYCEDEAIRFHSSEKEQSNEANDGKNDSDVQSKGPKDSDWRHGPAQYWYDMLNLPEKVEGFDYNLKLAIDNIPQTESDTKVEQEVNTQQKETLNNDCKIDQDNRVLLYACRNCDYRQLADSCCVYVNKIMHEVKSAFNSVLPDVVF